MGITAMTRTGNTQARITAQRVRALDAEQRVNLVRVSAITGFYLLHLWHVSAPRLGQTAASIIGFASDEPVSSNVHIGVTLICLGWLMQAFAIHMLIAQGRVSDLLATLSTLGDLFWLTAALCLSSGPTGPMVAGYFLIIMLTGLRFNLWLVRVTTICAAASYLFVLGISRWQIGIVKEIGYETVPRYHQLMVLLAIAFSGVIIGQIVRQTYAISDFANRPLAEEKP